MEFDYRKLRGRIQERFGTEVDFARAMGLTYASLSRKLRNEDDFTRGQMIRAARLLNIGAAAIPDYFFVEKVQKNELFVESMNRGPRGRSGYLH